MSRRTKQSTTDLALPSPVDRKQNGRLGTGKATEQQTTAADKKGYEMTFQNANVLFLVLFIFGTSCGQREPPVEPSTGSRLHDELIVVDGHVHMTNSVFHQGIDPWKPQSIGTFDYARAKQGGLDVAIEHLYIEDAYNKYNYTVKQACRLIETFYRILEANKDKMGLALTSQDVRGIVAQGKMAVVLALEGGFDMEGDLDVLRVFHRLGIRMVQFTNHDTTNALVDSSFLEKWDGISQQGRAVIREMNRLGIVIDISHASEKAKGEIIEASQAPVVTSHNGLQHFSSCPGNITDETLQAWQPKAGSSGCTPPAGSSAKSLSTGGFIVRERRLPLRGLDV